MSAVHVVVPEGIDDPRRPSGGNAYDRHVCGELAALGWEVHEHAVAGTWPTPTPESLAALAGALAAVPDGAVVLVDGLIASVAPEAMLPEAARLRVVVLLHMPLLDERERTVLTSAAAVVTTSDWARDRVVDEHGLPGAHVHVAEPGAEAAALAPGTPDGGNLLCVAAVVPAKGHDTLLDALARISHLDWRCTCVGALDLDPGFVDYLRDSAKDEEIADRVTFTGPLTGARLAAAYDDADLLVSASRRESFGMAVTEALARGIPVVVSTAGGLPQAVGLAADGSRPGLLFPPDDAAALARHLSHWLDDPDLRDALRESAARRRTALGTWSRTAQQVGAALSDPRIA